MIQIQEGQLVFVFRNGVAACKYDDWSFYRNQFQNGCYRDNKAMDLLCLCGTVAWMIEIKDYRCHCRTKAVDLADEIAIKVRDTLAGLAAAQTQANNQDEQLFAQQMLRAARLRVVCHIEQPAKASRLRPRVIEPDKLKDRLRRELKAIDPHPLVMDRRNPAQAVPWQVMHERKNP